MSTGDSDQQRRFTSLDGLRGLAAVIVVIHHVALTNPTLAGVYVGSPAPTGTWAWWVSHTPLHLGWAGTEAVYVFFVLSGFVLTLPFLGKSAGPWPAYYRKRLVRLYLPVWASLIFAAALWSTLDRRATGDVNWWLDMHVFDLSLRTAVSDATLFNPTPLNGALWSLRWEVAFSLLLPAYVVAANALRRLGLFGFAYPLALVFVGSATNSDALLYLPMFLVGSLIAMHRHRLLGLASSIPPSAWPVVAGCAVLLLTARWTLVSEHGVVVGTVGASLIVCVFLTWPLAEAFGKCALSQWLGKVSFSLYLVHLPIVLALASVGASGLILLPATLVLSLAVAWAFYVVVEAPTQRLARRASQGRAVTGTSRPVATTVGTCVAAPASRP